MKSSQSLLPLISREKPGNLQPCILPSVYFLLPVFTLGLRFPSTPPEIGCLVERLTVWPGAFDIFLDGDGMWLRLADLYSQPMKGLQTILSSAHSEKDREAKSCL